MLILLQCQSPHSTVSRRSQNLNVLTHINCVTTCATSKNNLAYSCSLIGFIYRFTHVDKIIDKSDYNASLELNYFHEYVLWLHLHAFIQNCAMGNATTVYNRALAVQFKSVSLRISISVNHLIRTCY